MGPDPIIDGCGVSFSGNSAADAGSTDDDNADTFGTSRSALTAPCVAAGPAIAVSGNGQAIGNGDTTPDAADGTAFGAVAVGSGGSAQTFSIANDGNQDLTVSAIAATGSGADAFAISGIGLPSDIGAASSTDFTLTFTPTAATTYRATLTISSDDAGEASYSFAVDGTGTGAPNIAVSASLDFGQVPVGDSTQRTLNIANTGNLPLAITSLSLTGANPGDFGHSGNPGSIPAGDTADVTLSFTPSNPGTRAATPRITSDDPDESPADVALSGFATTAPSGPRETLTGSAEVAERFVFTGYDQANGEIDPFTPGRDVLDIIALLAAIPGGGGDPFNDGTVTLRERRGSTRVMIDPDGDAGPRRAYVLTKLVDVPLSAIVPSRDIAVGID